MDNCNTSRPIPVLCNHWYFLNSSKEYSSSTILFHHKKDHSELPYQFDPSEINCNKCFQTIPIISLHIHSAICEKRIKKHRLGTIIEEVPIDDSRILCKYCRRRFVSGRIDKHEKACEMSSRRRPQFEMIRKRLPYLCETYQKINTKRASLNLIYPNSK